MRYTRTLNEIAVHRVPSAIGVVLAGGRGSRMGRPKASARLAGRPLIEYPLAAFREASLEVVVVAKPDTVLPKLDVPVWREPAEPVHPLCGIFTALRRDSGRAAIVCGCDMPFVSAELLAWLAGLGEPLVVPSLAGRHQPLLARYGGELVNRLGKALRTHAPLAATIEALGPRAVDEAELRRFGDPERLLFNVNTPADLEEAEQMLAGEGRYAGAEAEQ